MSDLLMQSSSSIPSGFHRYAGDARRLRIRLAFTSFSLLSAKPTGRLRRPINKQAEEGGSGETVNNDSAILDEGMGDCLATFMVEKQEGKWTIRGERSEIDWFNQRNGCLRLSVQSELLWDDEKQDEDCSYSEREDEDSPGGEEIVPYDEGRLESILVDRNSNPQRRHQFGEEVVGISGSKSNYNGNQRRPRRGWKSEQEETARLEPEMKTSGREFNWKCTSTTTTTSTTINTMTSDNNWQRTLARKPSVAQGMRNTLGGGGGGEDYQQSRLVYCGSAAAALRQGQQWVGGARGIDEDLSSLCAGCTTIGGSSDDHRGSLDDRASDGGDLLRDSYLDWLINRESELNLRLLKPYKRLLVAHNVSTEQGVSSSGESSGVDDDDDSDELDTDNTHEPNRQPRELTGVTRAAGRKRAQTGTRRLLRGELLFIKMESLGGSLVVGEAQVAQAVAADCTGTVFQSTTNSEHDATTVSATPPPTARPKPENRPSDSVAYEGNTHEQDEPLASTKRDHKGSMIGRTSTLARSGRLGWMRDQMVTELAPSYPESSDKVGGGERPLNPWRQRRQGANSGSRPTTNNRNSSSTSGKRVLAVILIDVLDRFIQLKPDLRQLIALDVGGQGGGEFVFRDASAASSSRTRQQFATTGSLSATTSGGASGNSYEDNDDDDFSGSDDDDDHRTSQEELTSVGGGQLPRSLFYELQLVACDTAAPEVALENRRKLMKLLREPALVCCNHSGHTPRPAAFSAGALLRLRFTLEHAIWCHDTSQPPPNLYAKYRLLVRQPRSAEAQLRLRLAGQSMDERHVDGWQDELCILEGSTITSRANAQGRFHLGCTEELMLEPIWAAEASVSSQLGQQRLVNQMAAAVGAPLAASETAELSGGAEGPAAAAAADRDSANERMAANMEPRWDVTKTPATTTTSSSTGGPLLASQQCQPEDKELSPPGGEQQALNGSRRPADGNQPTPLVDVPAARNSSQFGGLKQQQQVYQWPQLVLLLEFFSADFYQDKPQGFAHLIVPLQASGAIATNSAGHCQVSYEKQRLTRRSVPVLSVPLNSIGDRLRHHLTGQLPKWAARVDSFSQCNSHRYMMQTRESGQIVIDYEIGGQFSHPLQHKLDLLDQVRGRLSSGYGSRRPREPSSAPHTKMSPGQSEELDTEQVLEAYRRARERMHNLRLAQIKVPPE